MRVITASTLTSAVLATAGHTYGYTKGAKIGGIIHAPPVTVTETQTETKTKYSIVTAPPVTTTVTETETTFQHLPAVTTTVGELYDQSYGKGYELGDLVHAPTTITETKTFSVVYHGHSKERTSTAEVVHEWKIEDYGATEAVYKTEGEVVHITSTVWVDSETTGEPAYPGEVVHIPSTVLVDAEPTDEPA